MKSRALELRNIVNEFKQAYQQISENSYNEHIKTLPTGTPTPERGVIFGESYKRAFETQAESYRLRALALIDAEINDLKKKTTATPTEEDVRTLELLNMRTSISNEELNRYADKFSGSEVCYRTLQDIAAKSGNYLPDNLIESQITNLYDLKSSMNRGFTADSAVIGGMDFAMTIVDNYFTE